VRPGRGGIHHLQGAAIGATPPRILIRRALAGTVPITITAHIICPFDSCGTIQNVFVVHGAISYTMHLDSIRKS
jgi:hypothetical protein